MATKLYFRNTTNTNSGTFPTTAYYTAPGIGFGNASDITLLEMMLSTPGTGHASRSFNSGAVGSVQHNAIASFVSLPLSGAQTVGGGSIVFNCADAESNNNMNCWINQVCVSVWRPSTGAAVGTVKAKNDTTGGLGGTEPTSQNSIQVTHISGITSTAISAQDGDVIIVTLGSVFQPGMSTSYTETFYYNGTTENTTENSVVTNHASYIEFTENLVFQTGPTQQQKSSFFF